MLALLLVALVPTAARAQQPAATVAARALLIEQAERAAAAGDHRASLSLAERAGRIEMTPSLRMLIAQEQLASGAPAAAMASALTCVREGTRDATLPYRENLLARCRDVGQRARAAVALVVLRAPVDAPDVRVELDGQTLPPEVIDVPQPMDPGAHALVVRAPSRRPHAQSFDARVGEAQEVALELGAPEPVTPEPVAPQPLAPQPLAPDPVVREPAPVTPPRPTVSPRRGPPAGAVALAVVGAASLASSGVFFALRIASASGCAPGPDPATAERVWLCDDPAQVESVSMRGTWTTLSLVTLGVGVASLGAGVAWWVLGRSSATAARPSVGLVPGGAQLSLAGTF